MKRAGQLVARQSVKKDGYVLTGYYDKVKIGIKRTNGKIGTIFR